MKAPAENSRVAMVGAKVGLAQTRNKHPASGGWKHPCACDYRRYVIAGRLRHWVVNRVKPPVKIATDNHRAYAFHIRQHFGYEGYNYGTETKIFGDRLLSDGTLARLGRNEGVRRMQTAERSAVLGSPDLESLTTSHIERAFLTVRQELKRFPTQRTGLQQRPRNAQAGSRAPFRRLQFRSETSYPGNNARLALVLRKSHGV